METISLNVEARDIAEKPAKVRNAGRIPAVVYGADDNVHISATFNEVKKLIYTPDFKLAEFNVDGKSYKCIIKDVQFHPLTEEIQHIDFLSLKDGHKIKAEIPVRFKGASPGVKLGGKLMQSLRKVKVKIDPKDLIEELFVDISELELGGAVRVRDIELNDNIEMMVNPATPIAVVEIPRAVKSAAAEEEKAAAADGAAAPTEGDAPAAEG